MKVLLVRLGALGDIIHAVPAALALAAIPGTEIDWLVDPRHHAVLNLFDLPVRPVALSGGGASAPPAFAPPASSPAGILDSIRTIRALRQRAYDVAIDLQGLIKSAVLARLSGARRVIGFARHALREPSATIMYTETVDPGTYGHVIQKNVALVSTLAKGASDTAGPKPGLRIAMPLKARTASPATAAAPYAIINPGAGWPNKRWAADRFGAIAKRLRAKHGLAVVVTWGPGEEPLARAVVESSSGAAQEAPPTTLPELLALIRGAQLMIAGDTGPLHLAAAASTPIVSMFGPTDPKRNGPWASDDVSVSEFHHCICHHKRECSRATRCLDDISVDDVTRAVAVRLDRAGAAKR